jgi:hypothetical protein
LTNLVHCVSVYHNLTNVKQLVVVFMKRTYYVYEHHRPDNNTCFYVGLGYDDYEINYYRSTQFSTSRSIWYMSVIYELRRQKLKPVVLKIHDNLTLPEAHKLENWRIIYYVDLNHKLANRYYYRGKQRISLHNYHV